MRLDKIIEELEKYGYNVFTDDMKEEEVDNNPSFFYYADNYRVSRGESYWLKSFDLYFITRENKEIDVIELIEKLSDFGLYFLGSETEDGKVEGTDQKARSIYIEFGYTSRKIYCG